MNKKIVSVVVAAGLVMGTSSPAMAKPLNQTLKQQKSQLQKDKASLSKVQGQREGLEEKVEVLDSNIENIMAQVKKVEGKITSTEKEIEITKKDLIKAQAEVDKGQKLFNQRVRAMYINGADSYLSVLLESESFSDLISRLDMVKRIVSNDKEIIAKLNNKKQEVDSKKQALDTDKQKLIALKSENQNELAKLNKTKGEQTKLLAQLASQESMYKGKISDSEGLVASTLKKLQEQASRAVVVAAAPKVSSSTSSRTASRGTGYDSSSNSSNSSSSSSTSKGSMASGDVVSYATNFLGVPYVWGGTSPSGFDCSGFVQYVYAHFGVNLPRVASAQAGVGASVSRSNLQAGDLVFFGKGNIHHVGMYVGNGCYIHAPRTGDNVKISPLNRSDFACAKRVR
ncbi:NlpC/P60 family protein [Haloimpatiens sp. FM7315]|uniref:C40 family peptidase n=1 Tax=Haloimpatiens sp. FM7315 TaxID=3298609 RepID=UPI00370C7A62